MNGSIVGGPIYLVSFVKYNGFPRTVSTRDLMSAVTTCQWLDDERIPYKLAWVDADKVKHDGCAAIEDKLAEAAEYESNMRRASEPCFALPHSSQYGRTV